MSDSKIKLGFYVVCGMVGYYSYFGNKTNVFNAYTDPISERQKWFINKEGGEYSKDWTRSEASHKIKQLLGDKSKPKPPVKLKPKVATTKPNRNPLSIMPTTLVDEVGVMFNKDNDEVVGAVAHPTKDGMAGTLLLLAGDAQQGGSKMDLKIINPTYSNQWFAWKQEPHITFEDSKFIVGVMGIITYKLRSYNINSFGHYKNINLPPKPTTQDNTYNSIGEIKGLKEDIIFGNYSFKIKWLKQAISKIPAKDTFELYVHPKGFLMFVGADWTLYIAGRKI
jgi:hypothetical protein